MQRCLLVILSVIMLLSGCRKVMNTQPSSFGEPQTMKELVVSSGFNWASSREVAVRIPVSMQGVVKITSEDGKVSYFKGKQNGVKEMDVTLSVPGHISRLSMNSRNFDLHPGICGPGTHKSVDFLPLSFGAPYTYNNSSTRCPDAVALDNDRFVVTYAWGDWRPSSLRVGTRSGSAVTWGPVYDIGDSECAFYATATHLVKAGLDKILVANAGHMNGYLGLFSVTGNSFLYHSRISIPFKFNYPSVVMLDDSRFIFAYTRESTSGSFARFGSISGTTIGAKAEVPLTNAQRHLSVTKIDDNRVLFTYRNGNTGETRACVGSITDFSKLTISPDYVVESDNSYFPSVAMLDADRFIITYMDRNAGNTGFVRIGTVSGTTLTFGPKIQFSYHPTEELFVYARDAANIILVYSEIPASNYVCNYLTGEVSGNSVTFSSPVVLANTNGVSPSVCSLGPDNLLAVIADYSGVQPGNCFLSASLQPDTDEDDIPDAEDDYPADPTRAFNNFLPAAGYGSLGFEDLWPSRGDYDFNDVVVDYQFQTVTNATNEVVEIFARFTLQANGATLDNGFGFNLPGCDPSLTGSKLLFEGYHLGRSYITLNSSGNEEGQSKPTIIAWDNTSDLMPDLSNTIPGHPYQSPVEFTIKLTTPGYSFPASAFALTSYNPFIIIDMDRGKEVHLADRPPTSLADPSLLGTWEDNSIPAQNRFYKTLTNLPWAIDIPESFAWPTEKTEITRAHLRFSKWAQSSGSLYPDWFCDKPGYRNPGAIYPR